MDIIRLMELSGLVNEMAFQSHDFTPEQLKLIQTHCQPFLKLVGNNINDYRLYRGAPPKHEDVQQITDGVRLIKRQHQQNPKLDRHDRGFDNMFVEKYGIPFRSEMYVTGDFSTALGYGDTSIIFPVGEFRFAWSPEVYDLIVSFRKEAFNMGWRDLDKAIENNVNLLDKFKYVVDKDFAAAIKSKKEIMIYCDQYLAIELTAFNKIRYVFMRLHGYGISVDMNDEAEEVIVKPNLYNVTRDYKIKITLSGMELVTELTFNDDPTNVVDTQKFDDPKKCYDYVHSLYNKINYEYDKPPKWH